MSRGDDRDNRRSPTMGTGSGLDQQQQGVRDPRSLDPADMQQQQGREEGAGRSGPPGRGFGSGPGGRGAGMQGKGALGGDRGRGSGREYVRRGVGEFPPPPDFQQADGLGLLGGPDRNRRGAGGPGGGPPGSLLDRQAGGHDSRVGGVPGGMGSGAMPWRNEPIDMQGRGRGGPGGPPVMVPHPLAGGRGAGNNGGVVGRGGIMGAGARPGFDGMGMDGGDHMMGRGVRGRGGVVRGLGGDGGFGHAGAGRGGGGAGDFGGPGPGP